MFQICVLDQKVQENELVLHLNFFLKMKSLGTLKYIISLILLKFQNL
jgi:hypothetical protein